MKPTKRSNYLALTWLGNNRKTVYASLYVKRQWCSLSFTDFRTSMLKYRKSRRAIGRIALLVMATSILSWPYSRESKGKTKTVKRNHKRVEGFDSFNIRCVHKNFGFINDTSAYERVVRSLQSAH